MQSTTGLQQPTHFQKTEAKSGGKITEVPCGIHLLDTEVKLIE